MSNFDETFDFVVVGSGGGSMCSALAMRASGKSVLVVEKTSLIGGTSARSGGVMWIPNNRFMKRDGVEDSTEKSVTYLEAVSGGRNDTPGSTPERRRTYVEQGARMVDFLVEQGIKLTRIAYWPDYYDELPGGSQQGRTVIAELFNVNELGAARKKFRPNAMVMMAPLDELLRLQYIKKSWEAKWLAVKMVSRTAFAKLTGKHYVTGGGALQGRMFQASLKAGVEFLTDTPVSELVVENGAVTGIVMVKEGKTCRVGARLGVLVNAGGFSHNQAMRDQYQPGTQAKWTNTAEGDTGEMIQEMMRHGAAIAQMDEMVGNQMSFPPGTETDPVKPVVQGVTASPHAILVDQSGVRYMNEAGSYMAYCKGMLTRNQEVPAVPSWAIMDEQFMSQYMLASSLPGSKKPKNWFTSGFLKKAETVEELAGLIGVDPGALRATVDRFNGFVAKNHDDDFSRGDRAYDRWLGDPYHESNPSLGSINQRPFYAMAVVPGDVGTYGGVVTDKDARVLREDGSVIEGLYATGISTASVMGRVYPGAGASVGPSFVWGYVAAQHALAQR